jgi:hypothetical protein
MAITLKRRAYAGMWFMAAGLVPFLYRLPDLLPTALSSLTLELVGFILVPVLVTGLIGSLLGAGILDPYKVRNGWHAAFRGFIIAALSFLLSAILISAWDVSNNEYESFVNLLFMMLIVGTMVIGWMAVIVGTFAGWLLYQLREFRPNKTDLL